METVNLPAGGRRIVLSADLENQILIQLAQGIPLTKICDDKSMPSRDTVMRWERADPAFATKCARARKAAGSFHAERLLEINRKLETGEIEAAAANVISGNLKWIAARLNPKQFGDKVTISGDEDNPILVKDVTREILNVLTIEQLEQIEQLKLTHGGDDDAKSAGDKTEGAL